MDGFNFVKIAILSPGYLKKDEITTIDQNLKKRKLMLCAQLELVNGPVSTVFDNPTYIRFQSTPIHLF